MVVKKILSWKSARAANYLLNAHLMDLLSKVLLYLDKTGYLTEMERACREYSSTLTEKNISKFPPLRHLLEIDSMHLINSFPDLGNIFICEPAKWKQVCSEILYACLQSIIDEEIYRILPAQVGVHLRLKSVPNDLIQCNPKSYSGLFVIKGTLIAVSKSENYVFHTVWCCPEECESNEVILQYIPKAPPKCQTCRSSMFENSGLRRCGEKVVATFKIKNNLLSQRVNIVDDLIVKLKLGSSYNLYSASIKKNIEVMCIEEVVPLAAPLTTPVPADIEELFNACKGLSWKFIYCLASSIGIKVCPLNCFMQLKISLLLSLTSVKANKLVGSTIMHVLVAGHDTGYAGRLMEEAAKLARVSVAFGTSQTTTPSALITSSGGVCYLPLPLHCYNKKHISEILTCIETGEITNDTAKVKIQTAVWSQGIDFKKIALQNIASVFGTVCRGDCGEYNDELADFVVQNAIQLMTTSKEERAALVDIVDYIDLVSGLEVSMNDDTETLLRNYFMAARRERANCVTVGGMSALVACCLTSARLCRRRLANIDDAVFAIWLHVSGSAEPRFAPDEYLQTPADIKLLQKIFIKFKEWLEQFTGTCVS